MKLADNKTYFYSVHALQRYLLFTFLFILVISRVDLVYSPYFLWIGFSLGFWIILWGIIRNLRLSFLVLILAIIFILIYSLGLIFIQAMDMLGWTDNILEMRFDFDSLFTLPLLFFGLGLLLNYFFFTSRLYLIFEWIFLVGFIVFIIWLQLDYQAKFQEEFSDFPSISIFIGFLIILLIIKIILEMRIPRFKKDLSEKHKFKDLPKTPSHYLWLGTLIVLLLLFFVGFVYLIKQWLPDPGMGLFSELEGGEDPLIDLERYLNLFPEVQPSHEVVMYVNMEAPLYNRLFIVSGFNADRGFYLDKENEYELDIIGNPEDDRWELPIEPDYIMRTDFLQRYYILNFDMESLFGCNFPLKTFPITNVDPMKYQKTYATISKVFRESYGILKHRSLNYSNTENDFIEYYTQYGEDPDYKALADSIIGESSTVMDAVSKIIAYFQNNFEYSLSPGGEEDQDLLKYFLFQNKKGYCTYFAFGMTVLCRSLGIPSRVAVGFSPNPGRQMLNYYMLLGSDAHAWVEIYFEDYGWISFDPTPTLNLSALDSEAQMGSQENMQDFLADIMQLEQEQPPTEDLMQEDENVMAQIEMSFQRKILFILLIVLYLMVFYIIATAGVQLYRKQLPFRTGDNRRSILRAYTYMMLSLRRAGIQRKYGQTAMEFADQWQSDLHPPLQQITQLYLKARYDQASVIMDQKQLKAIIENIDKALLKNYPRWKILLNWFNPGISWKRSSDLL